MLCLASILYNAGYVRRGEYHLTDENGYDETQYIGDLGSRKVYTATSKEDIEPAVIVSTDKNAKIYLGAESKEVLEMLEEKEQKAKEHFSRYE